MPLAEAFAWEADVALEGYRREDALEGFSAFTERRTHGSDERRPDAGVLAPARGVRVVHLASLGPGPHGAMLLADLGADVIVVDRPMEQTTSVPPTRSPATQPAERRPGPQGRRQPRAHCWVSSIPPTFSSRACGPAPPSGGDRTGRVPGPQPAVGLRPMTGWGQDGPLAQAAAHVNYVALSGALDAMGDRTGRRRCR